MHRPLVFIATGFAFGIFLGAQQGLWAFSCLAGACLVMLVWQRRRPQNSLLTLAAAICGLVWFVIRTPVWPGAYTASWSDMRILSIAHTANSTQLTVQVEALGGQQLPRWNPVKAQITFPLDVDLVVGDKLRGEVNWQALSQPLNPGEFNYAQYLRRQGILASAYIGEASRLEHEPSLRRPWPLRNWLLARAARVPGEPGELLGTLTLGTRPGLWSEAWRSTGLAHVLSISGLHVGLVLVPLLGLLRFCRLSQRQANFVAALVLLVYGYVLGPKPAVWRAIIMALTGMLAVTSGRTHDWPSAVAIAAILLLLYNPHYLWDAGWQLSFAATIGLLYFAPRIREYLPLLPFRLDWAISASLAAQLATLPLVLHHFYLFPPLTLVFNIFLAPLLPPALIGGLLYLLLPGLGELLLPLLQFFYAWLLRLVQWWATWPLASFNPGLPPLVLTALYLGLLLLFFAGRDAWRPVVAGTLALTFILLLTWQPLTRWVGNVYNFTVLSVGQGAAAALHLPGSEIILFDVGGGYPAVGRQVIVPYLRYRGTWRIRAIYLSHLHEDHINGLADVLAAFPVAAIYLPTTSLSTPAYSNLAPLLQEHGVTVYPWKLGDMEVYEGLRVTAINPKPGAPQDENEDSLVLVLEWPNLTLLVPGDIGSREEELLPYLPAAVDVLLVPHHGSANSSSESFLRLLRPRHAVISTGRNLYGHPAEATLQRLQHYGDFVWRTDHSGAITVINSHRGSKVIPFLRP